MRPCFLERSLLLSTSLTFSLSQAKPDAELSAPTSARSTPPPAASAPSSAAPSPAAAPSPLRIKLPARGAKRAASASPPLPDDTGSSASASRTPRKRVAAPSAAAAAGPSTGGEASGTSTSGRSLRVRMPVRPQRDEVVREEVDEPRARRSTRASAAKARGKLVEENGASDVEEEKGQAEAAGQAEEEGEGAEGGGDSDYGFEYEDD